MKCRSIHKKLIFYIEGELPHPEMREIERHLKKCSGCASFAEELKKTMSVVDLEKNVPDAPYLFTRIKARMQDQQEAALQNKEMHLWERLLQPAVFTLLLLAGIYTGIKIGSLSTTGLPATGYTETEMIPFLNELDAEPLELFLME